MHEHISPPRQEKHTFSILSEEKKFNQEPFDAEIIDEETSKSPASVELHSGEVREPGVHDGEIITDEQMAALLEKRKKEDAEADQAYEKASHTHEESVRHKTTMNIGSFVTSEMLGSILAAARRARDGVDDYTTIEHGIVENETAEKFFSTFSAIDVALTLLPKDSMARTRLEKTVRLNDETELSNLNKIRATLTKKYKEALKEGRDFTPEMAMELYEKLHAENSKADYKKFDPELEDRYYKVKELFMADERALLAFMGMGAEEITTQRTSIDKAA